MDLKTILIYVAIVAVGVAIGIVVSTPLKNIFGKYVKA